MNYHFLSTCPETVTLDYMIYEYDNIKNLPMLERTGMRMRSAGKGRTGTKK